MARFKPGDQVQPMISHMAGQQGQTARVAEVHNGPYYALDFGDGKPPHKWYAENELQPARAGHAATASTWGQGGLSNAAEGGLGAGNLGNAAGMGGLGNTAGANLGQGGMTNSTGLTNATGTKSLTDQNQGGFGSPRS